MSMVCRPPQRFRRRPLHARRRSWHPRLPGRLWLRTALVVATVTASVGGTLAGRAAAAGTPPGAPTLVSASASGSSVTLTWTNGSGAQGANAYQNGVKHWVGGSPNPTPTTYTYTGLANGTYTYQVANYNGAGQGPLSNSMTATVGGPPPAPPTVTSLAPTSGDENGGTGVTVNGTNFTGATAVHFGATAAASFTVTGTGTISATSPAAAATGPVDVTVTTPSGTSAVSQPADQFTYTTPPAPTVTLVNPNGGPAGTSVTVSGTDLTGATAVDFGTGNAATFTVNSNTTLQATAPSGTGTVDVTVTTPSGTSAVKQPADQFSYSAGTPPTPIPSPDSGGWQANGATKVNTGASPPNVQLTQATGGQAGSIFWPKAEPGVGISAAFDTDIYGGSGGDGMTFTLADASVTKPTALGANGSGDGFSGILGIAVTFDTYKANTTYPSSNFVGISLGTTTRTNSLTYATTNSSIASLRNSVHHFVVTTFSSGLSVTMDGAQVLSYATTLPASVLVGFTGGTGGHTDIHQIQNVAITAGPPPPSPSVSSVSPSSGPETGGTSVTISGSNLTGATAVDFGGTAARSFTNNADGTITAVSPAGTGTVDVFVTTGGGASASNPPGDQFTYNPPPPPPPPTVTAVSPTSGPTGTLVTVSGSGFTGASAVDFGSGNPAVTFNAKDDGSLTATAPSGTGGTVVDVTVTTKSGTSAINQPADQYTYTVPPQPVVDSVSPTSGYNGTLVTVSGSGFTGATAVDFGSGNPAATFNVTGDSSLTATAPSGTGTVDITVTTGGGTSNVSQPADQFAYLAGPPPPTLVATYRGDLSRTGYDASETGLTSANAASLKVHWTDTGGSGSFAQPIMANGLVYWSDWKGVLHATNPSTGTDTWTTNIGITSKPSGVTCARAFVGPIGTPVAAMSGSTPVLYVPGGNGVMYELNATTGAQIWSTSIGPSPNNILWSSPALYNGNLYVGVAHYEDCLGQIEGHVDEIDASTGTITHIFYTLPPAPGCSGGGGVWSSPAIDPSDNSVYISTGDPGTCSGAGVYAPAIVKLSATDLSLISSWVVPTSEQTGGGGDADFGGTPTLFTATISGTKRSLVGAVDKDGLFFALDRTNLAAGPVWQSTIATPSSNAATGSIVSAAWDGTNLYVAGGVATTNVNGKSCNGTNNGTIDALNPASGAFVWRTCESSQMYGGITAVPGVVVEGTLGKTVQFLNASTGATLLSYVAASMVEGECAVSNGVVYIPEANGNLVALGQ